MQSLFTVAIIIVTMKEFRKLIAPAREESLGV